jgi:Family of unknown function (DUF5360)
MVTDMSMPRGLSLTLKIVDCGMILYWALAAIACVGLISVPRELMYAGYGTRTVDAWNWSFAPLDLVFSLVGLIAVRMARNNDPRWRGMALISLALTFCAGLMAVSFWTLMGYFDLSWWIPNVMLMAFALWWLPKLSIQN